METFSDSFNIVPVERAMFQRYIVRNLISKWGSKKKDTSRGVQFFTVLEITRGNI